MLLFAKMTYKTLSFMLVEEILGHGDFCSDNYNIAGTPNLNSNSNSSLKVAVNLYVFFIVVFFSGWKLQRCLGSNFTTICPRVPSSRTLRL